MKTKKVVIDRIKYSLNDKNMTAMINSFDIELIDLIIPESITYKSKEYIVIGIKYEEYSMISVKSITIPSSLKYFDSELFNESKNLIDINVSSENKYYSLYENKFIIGKSSEVENEDEFDVLVFCARNVKNVTIPKFIKTIGPYSFQYCNQLDEINFEPNSKLEKIEKCAFQNSSIKSIVTPPSLKIIYKKAFENCDQLKLFEIPIDSEIHTIQRYAFMFSSIENINITSKLVNLEKFWCLDTPKLNTFRISPYNPMYLSYDDKFIIGKSISYIEVDNNEDYDEYEEEEEEEEEFKDEYMKEEIEKVNNNNKEEEEFNNENYEDKEEELNDIESKEVIDKKSSEEEDDFHENENKDKIDEFNILIFSVRNIVEASIPSFIKSIGACSFNQCIKLQKVEFSKNSKLQSIDEGAFSYSSLKNIDIPTNVTIIHDNAFAQCKNLANVEFSVNSKLTKIEQFAFINSRINIIHIPASLINIEMSAFSLCSKLLKIDIPDNSMLQKIEYSVFQDTPIKSIFIPSKINDIGYNNFDKIQIVEVDKNFENIKFLPEFFNYNKHVIILIPSNLWDRISK